MESGAPNLFDVRAARCVARPNIQYLARGWSEPPRLISLSCLLGTLRIMFKSMFSSGIRSLYAVLDNPTFASDPWTIYPAKRNSNGRLASVFIFDKKRFEAQVHALTSSSAHSKNPKALISECYELIKFEIGQSVKLKHPQILTIIEPLEETKLKFIFVLEPVQNNLKTVQLAKLDTLTVQKGLLQVAKSLQFLHNTCSIIHFNLQPLSVYINDQGDWKLFGFRFVHNLNELSASERDSFYIMNNSSPVPFTNLNLNFTAPEILLDSTQKLSLANDIWSLGCLVYYLYTQGQYLVDCFDSDSISDFKDAFRKFENRIYKDRSGMAAQGVFQAVPQQLLVVLPSMIARYPHDRITIDQFIDCDFFSGSIIKAMWFIDEFATKSVDEKIVFMKGLTHKEEGEDDVLGRFPTAFNNLKLLPLMIDVILNELKVMDPAKKLDEPLELTISLALNLVLQVGASISSLSFQDKIYSVLLKDTQLFWKKATGGSTNTLSPFKSLTAVSPRIRLALLDNLTTIRTKLNDKQFVDVVKGIAEPTLSAGGSEQPSTDQIRGQEQFLASLAQYVSVLDFPFIKHTLFPLICQVFQSTTVLSTKLATIGTFGDFVDQHIVDKLIVVEQLLPILNNLKSRDKLVVDRVLTLFSKLTSSEHVSLDIEITVGKILPQCWLLTFGCNNCVAAEFEAFVATVQRVERDLVSKRLRQLPQHSAHVGELQPKGSSDFQVLVNKQKFNDGSQDQIVKAPKTGLVMQPSRRAASISKADSVGTPKQANVTTKTPPLSFGATSTRSAVDKSALLRTLNDSYAKPEEDDEFDDFQSTAATPVGVDWNIEVEKTKPMNQRTSLAPTFTPNAPYVLSFTSPIIPSGLVNSPQSMATSPAGFPPGFDFDTVLKPTSKH